MCICMSISLGFSKTVYFVLVANNLRVSHGITRSRKTSLIMLSVSSLDMECSGVAPRLAWGGCSSGSQGSLQEGGGGSAGRPAPTTKQALRTVSGTPRCEFPTTASFMRREVFCSNKFRMSKWKGSSSGACRRWLGRANPPPDSSTEPANPPPMVRSEFSLPS